MKRTIFTATIALLVAAGTAWAADPVASPTPGTNTSTDTMQHGSMDHDMGTTTGTTDTTTNTDATKASTDTNKSDLTANADQKALEFIHTVNLMEIDAGSMAKEKAHAKGVKAFADRLIKDHKKLDGQIMKEAKAKGFDLKIAGLENTANDVEKTAGTDVDAAKDAGTMEKKDFTKVNDPDLAEAARKMDDLKNLTGADFDRQFVEQMKTDHENVAKKLKDMKKDVKDSKVKKLVTATITGVDAHRQLTIALLKTLPERQNTRGTDTMKNDRENKSGTDVNSKDTTKDTDDSTMNKDRDDDTGVIPAPTSSPTDMNSKP